jgi:hypothetical protein
MKVCRLIIIVFGIILASSPAALADNGSGDDGRRFAIAPGAGGQITNTKGEGQTAGVAVSALFQMKDLPRFWPDIIGLNFAMNGDQNPDDPLVETIAPENTLSLEGWWMILKGGPLSIGPGAGGTWANFGVESTDFGGIYGMSIVIEAGDVAPDLMITIADHFNLDRWDGFNLQGRVQFVKDFELAF